MKPKHLINTVLLLVLMTVLIGFLPVKEAVKHSDLDKTENYIIVNVQKATISQWIAIGNNNRIYDVPIDVRLTGNVPGDYSYSVESGFNSFVCYGEFDGVGDLHGEKYDVFDVERWEILYPVKRNSPFSGLLPSSYLCMFDVW